MNTAVTFEIAKLLKEKSFTSVFTAFSNKYYNNLGNYKVVSYNVKIENDEYEAPTIADVIMWLYEKHNIWISLIPDSSSQHRLVTRKFSVSIFKYHINLNVQAQILRVNNNIAYFISLTKAYEAAIEYVLTNLI